MLLLTWSSLLSNLPQMSPPECSVSIVLFIRAPRLLPGLRVEILVQDSVCLFTGTLVKSTLNHLGA
jgi:hypothetical protein